MEEKDKKTNQLKDFDWEDFENALYTTITKEELDKAYEATLNKVSPHQIVDTCKKNRNYFIDNQIFILNFIID